MKKIVMTGGGTAGHVTPNIALMPALKEADTISNTSVPSTEWRRGLSKPRRFLITAFHPENCADTLTGRTLQTRSVC